MTATLYYHPYSQHSRKVLVLKEELGFELELKSIDVRPRGHGGANERPEFLQINANGKIPVLVDGDFLLWESNAIAWYLAETHGDTQLWPRHPKERAAVAKWQLWQVGHLSPTLDGFLVEHMQKTIGGSEPDPAKLDQHQRDLERWGSVLNLQLEGRDYLELDRFTLADIAVSTAMMHDQLAQFSFAQFRFVQQWIDRVRARPSWQDTQPPPMNAR